MKDISNFAILKNIFKRRSSRYFDGNFDSSSIIDWKWILYPLWCKMRDKRRVNRVCSQCVSNKLVKKSFNHLEGITKGFFLLKVRDNQNRKDLKGKKYPINDKKIKILLQLWKNPFLMRSQIKTKLNWLNHIKTTQT